jgi:hypothetical protein
VTRREEAARSFPPLGETWWPSQYMHDWFYVMFLVPNSCCGVAAKQVEPELGVSYKTAWRMLGRSGRTDGPTRDRRLMIAR